MVHTATGHRTLPSDNGEREAIQPQVTAVDIPSPPLVRPHQGVVVGLGSAEVVPLPPESKLQRIFDIVASGSLLLALLPLFLLLAVLISVDSQGPILFIQRRVGRHGKEFNVYKFRSMVINAEELRHQLETMNERNGPVFKMENDPRITRVGRVIRKFSLDELPQLINVFTGEMSLVGPRPALPKEVAEYNVYQQQRLLVTPGITGLWQVSGRAKLTFDESIELDLKYISERSIKSYFSILLRTVPEVLNGKGAY